MKLVAPVISALPVGSAFMASSLPDECCTSDLSLVPVPPITSLWAFRPARCNGGITAAPAAWPGLSAANARLVSSKLAVVEKSAEINGLANELVHLPDKPAGVREEKGRNRGEPVFRA